MRHKIESILGKLYCYLAIETRCRLDITQEEMGELFYMSVSSYSDIETGVTNCVGTLTTTRFLNLQENFTNFLQEVERAITDYFEKEM